MGAFNVVTLPEVEDCPTCGLRYHQRVQFKYGLRNQLEYRVGDRLEWAGRFDVGQPGRRRGLVAGHGENCPRCRDDRERVYEIELADDVIVAVTPGGASGFEKFGHEGYVVLEG